MSKKKKSSTRHQLEKDKKREMEKDLDYLRQVELPEGQGGGRKIVEETIKDEQEKDKKFIDDTKTDLQGKPQFSYRRSLAEYGYERLVQADFDQNWQFFCIPTDGTRINLWGKNFKTQQGVLVIVKSPKGNVYVRGIRVTGDPIYDVKALDILVIQAENTIDSEKGLLLGDNKDTNGTLKRTKSGIILPNE